MAFITRQGKGSRLTIEETDGTLNYLYTASANAATSSISASYASTASYMNGIEPYTYIEISISSAEILDMGSNPIILLPPSGVSSYYEFYGILEYTYGTTNYTIPSDDTECVIGLNSYSGSRINNFLKANTPSCLFFRSGDIALPLGDVRLEPFQLNESIVFATYNGNNPIDGDGTILAKIWYKVKTFGSEL